MFAILAPKGVVYPYIETAKRYLQAGASANVGDYKAGVNNPQLPVRVEWAYDGAAAAFRIEYGLNADFSGASLIEVGGKRRFSRLYNLFKAAKYFLRITALSRDGEALESVCGEFETTSLGPRVMNIDRIYNVRDLGGHETSFGKRIVQGLAYRGGSLTKPPRDIFDSHLTARGKKTMKALGIKTELELRGLAEAGVETGSVIPEAMLLVRRVDGYDSAMKSWQEAYRAAFAAFADADNYPLYFHCTGGADRTGTIAFLLHALLGVDETTCIQDYEFTSFSVYGERNARTGTWANYFQPFYSRLLQYEGNSLQEKTERYFLSIGVTAEQIANIKAIFFGETPIKGKRELRMIAPQGIVYPYMGAAKRYLQAGEGANITDYLEGSDHPQTPVYIRWQYKNQAARFCIEYGVNEDFSGAKRVTVGGKKRSLPVYNLRKAAQYFVRITALDKDGRVIDRACGEFLTTELGPRVMNIDGIYNVRDLGGYQTAFGKRTLQGLAYRGGALTPRPRDVIFHRLTKKGKQTMAELGIQAELDFRDEAEAGVSLAAGSCIDGATLTYHTVGSYAGLLTVHREECRKIFSYLANPSNYPLYCHCSAGADRTGSVCCLLLALLGVSKTECVQDYEFTSFSLYDERNAKAGSFGEAFEEYFAVLEACAGEALHEKAENFLLSIGVTKEEIENIRAIFFGEIPIKL